MRIFAALFFAASIKAVAQSPQVPHKMDFAGITLTIRDDARREIQKDVDALTQSPRHYNIKAERARMYFPLIEKIFHEEHLPDDFKYLSLQESALIADAVSTSNAVGFWQFKDFTAMEMGLRVDKEVDERLNIASSTRAAARYIKKNNTFFDNWIYALQAYQMGAGGVMRSVSHTKGGARHMEITSKTYWYVKKFLAHKIAYEPGAVGTPLTPLVAYENKTGKSLKQLAKEVQIDEAQLLDFNKWTKSGWIPSDKTYVVVIPVTTERCAAVLEATASSNLFKSENNLPSVKILTGATVKKRINGVLAVQALPGETVSQFIARANVDLSKFLKWNDMQENQALRAGDFYFLSAKRGRASENFHKLDANENLWLISQQYGVKLRRLKKYNRLSGHAEPGTGTMLYLASKKPRTTSTIDAIETPVLVEQGETFNWSLTSVESPDLAKDSVSMSDATASLGKEPIVPADSLKQEIFNVGDPGKGIASRDSIALSVSREMPGKADSVKVVTETAFLTEMPVKKLEHTVTAKETLYSIAKNYGVTVMELVQWNDLNLQEGLRIGQVLKVSAGAMAAKTSPPTSDKNIVHEVKASDTLYSIARQYGVTIKELMDWNEKKDFSISVGEKLKIYQSR